MTSQIKGDDTVAGGLFLLFFIKIGDMFVALSKQMCRIYNVHFHVHLTDSDLVLTVLI